MKIDYWQSFEPECYYHVYNRAVEKDQLFRDKLDYDNFLEKYRKYLHPCFYTYAYCLMPNHFHFIIKVKAQVEIMAVSRGEQTNMALKYQKKECTANQLIGDQLRRMLSSISLKFNNKYDRRGPLFTPGVKRSYIDNNDRLRYQIGYLHHNPIHHDYESEFGSWKYSSYNSLRSSNNTLLAREEVMELFDDKISFDLFHADFKLQNAQENIDEVDFLE